MKIRDTEFDFAKKTYVMGILNVTPDSFSDGGMWADPRDAVRHAFEMEDAGADVIDVGAESTRPSATPVPASEEISRIFRVVTVTDAPKIRPRRCSASILPISRS